MTDPIDYSRPVGWWCPVCGASGKQVGNALHDELLIHGIVRCCTSGAADEMCFAIVIPVYLPIPEGQRPPAASEVEEAEVVTYIVGREMHAYGPPDPRLPWICRGSGSPPTFLDINRIVTGATE